jgi:hypothetical protein
MVLIIFLTCFILDNATSALLVKDSVTTVTALNNVTRLQGILDSTITTEVTHRLRQRIHHWFK